MKIGFTGTREGCTTAQLRALEDWLSQTDFAEAHHGACVGADDDFVRVLAFIDRATDYEWLTIHAYPSDMPDLTSASALLASDVRHQPRPPLDRNRDIVDACDALLACPDGPERLRSGTWSTVRYGRKTGKRIVIFWPDGNVTEEPAR